MQTPPQPPTPNSPKPGQPFSPQGPAANSPQVAAAQPLPPGSGGVANNKLMLAGLAGCGCLGLLMVAAVMAFMVWRSRGAREEGPQTAPPAPQVAPATPPSSVSAEHAAAAPADQEAVQYLMAAAHAALAAARGDSGDPRFGSPRTSRIESVVALGENPTVDLVVVELDGRAGSHNVRTVLAAFPDGRLRAAEAKLGRARTHGGFDASAGPELHALISRIGDDLMQRGRCPTLLTLQELEGLPQPLIAQLTRELGESQSECRGLRAWPGAQEPWSAHVDGILVIARGATGPVLVEAQLRPRRDQLTLSRIREPRPH